MSSPRKVFLAILVLLATACPIARAEDTMAVIPAGTYSLGEERRSTEVGSFSLDVHEVTNRQFAEFLNAVAPDIGDRWQSWVDTGETSRFAVVRTNGTFAPVQGKEDFPVVTVSWEGAAAYAEWAGKRLPTAVEWETAARGGAETRFPWGDTVAPCNANYFSAGNASGAPNRVMSFAPNGYGLYDVIGNVWEWTADDFHTDSLSLIPTFGISPAAGGTLKVLMGGSFLSRGEEISVYFAIPTGPTGRFGNVGFRCAKDMDPPGTPGQ